MTLIQLYKTKSAAESARDAADFAKDGVKKLDSVISFTSVANSLSEIRDALNHSDFSGLATRFDKARKSLINAKENHPGLDEESKKVIQKALVSLRTLELAVSTNDEAFLAEQRPRMLKEVLRISDEIATILASARNME